jgi:hypothetical protein
MENQSTPILRMRRTVTMLLSWLLFGVCLMVVLGEIFGFHAPALAHQETQEITAHHHHSGILDLQYIWNEMEYLYHAS